jgi:hypothetical protein
VNFQGKAHHLNRVGDSRTETPGRGEDDSFHVLFYSRGGIRWGWSGLLGN